MTSSRYLAFAVQEARGLSPIYEALARGVADDRHLVDLLDQLPYVKRQPNLLFASVRFLNGPVNTYREFQSWVFAHWPELVDVLQTRLTQTNEPGRMATLLPILAELPGPLALLEVGASAGLCLYPDKWRYEYGAETLGPESAPVLVCSPTGAFRAPKRLPEVVWRAGLDLNPMDVNNPDDVHWLEALVWPDQPERLQRLRAAIDIARRDPPRLIAGDVTVDLRDLAAQAPKDATLVVFHSAVLTYVEPEARQLFIDDVTSLDCHWISNEGAHVLPAMAPTLPVQRSADAARFLMALNGAPKAWTGPHGQSIEWFGG